MRGHGQDVLEVGDIHVSCIDNVIGLKQWKMEQGMKLMLVSAKQDVLNSTRFA